MQPLPLDLLRERLLSFDPNELLELLHITNEELLKAFSYKIKEHRSFIASELNLDIEQAFANEDDTLFSEDNTYDDFLEEHDLLEEQ